MPEALFPLAFAVLSVRNEWPLKAHTFRMASSLLCWISWGRNGFEVDGAIEGFVKREPGRATGLPSPVADGMRGLGGSGKALLDKRDPTCGTELPAG